MGSFEGYAATADGLSAVDTAVDFRDDTPEGKDPDAMGADAGLVSLH